MKSFKKKPARLLTSALLVSALLTQTVCHAADYGFPAAEILGMQNGITKSGGIGESICFSALDFDGLFGTPVETVTVISLPDAGCGELKYAGMTLTEQRSISRKNIPYLRFSPAPGFIGECSVTCRSDKGLTAVCTLKTAENVGTAPKVSGASYTASSGICKAGKLSAQGADGKRLTFRAEKYPAHGILRVSESGSFTYIADEGYSGRDVFTFSACDENGNRSAEGTVKLKVKRTATDLRYADMYGHWGEEPAMKMTELGLMSGTDVSGKLCFMPDAPMPRGDFLAMCMILGGLEDKIQPWAVTAFSDNDAIPDNIRGYAAFASEAGIVSGFSAETFGDGAESRAEFRSSDGITRAEAAVIMSGVLGFSGFEAKSIGAVLPVGTVGMLSGSSPEVGSSGENASPALSRDCFLGVRFPARYSESYADGSLIPVWAADSVGALSAVGIFGVGGSFRPNDVLTRAEAAKCLAGFAECSSEHSAVK